MAIPGNQIGIKVESTQRTEEDVDSDSVRFPPALDTTTAPSVQLVQDRPFANLAADTKMELPNRFAFILNDQ